MKRMRAGQLCRRETAVRLVVLLMLATALAGCGKKGAPQPPPGEPNTYPRSYPSE
jgi:predicted small lipoprotein YifL